jgi:hypothetical protein
MWSSGGKGKGRGKWAGKVATLWPEAALARGPCFGFAPNQTPRRSGRGGRSAGTARMRRRVSQTLRTSDPSLSPSDLSRPFPNHHCSAPGQPGGKAGRSRPSGESLEQKVVQPARKHPRAGTATPHHRTLNHRHRLSVNLGMYHAPCTGRQLAQLTKSAGATPPDYGIQRRLCQ